MRTENTSQSYFIPKVRDLTEMAHPANLLGHDSRQISASTRILNDADFVNVTKTPRTRIYRLLDRPGSIDNKKLSGSLVVDNDAVRAHKPVKLRIPCAVVHDENRTRTRTRSSTFFMQLEVRRGAPDPARNPARRKSPEVATSCARIAC